MKPWLPLLSSFAIFNVASASAESPAAKAAATLPNVLFIFADDLGWSDVGYNGSRYYETPRIDQLAKEGMTFSNAYVAAPNCAPSRAALMFGQYAPRTGCYTVGGEEGGGPENAALRTVTSAQSVKLIPPEKICLARPLSQAGISTAIFGKWHLGEYREYLPTERGFQHGFIIPNPHKQGDFGPWETRPAVKTLEGTYQSDFLADEALKFIEHRDREKPFFVYLPFFNSIHATHEGTQVPPDEALKAKYETKPPHGDDKDPNLAAKIERMDQIIGRMMDRLDALKLRESTLVIFYSDNGGPGGYRQMGSPSTRSYTDNAPLRGGKSTLYEGGIRVPLIMRWPGVTAPGSVCDTPVTGVDFYPTLLELQGGKPPANYPLDGVSLVPLLKGQPIAERPLFWHFPVYYGNKQKNGVWVNTPCSAIREGEWKLIEFFEDHHLELFHLTTDLSETKNLATTDPERAKAMHQRLQQWQRETGAFIPKPKP